MLVADNEELSETLVALKALGVRLVLDDFGTGYSSLSYLTRLPLDALKVDRSFVDGLGTESRDTAVTEAIVAMSRDSARDIAMIVSVIAVSRDSEPSPSTNERSTLRTSTGSRSGRRATSSRSRSRRGPGGPPAPSAPSTRRGPRRRASARSR